MSPSKMQKVLDNLYVNSILKWLTYKKNSLTPNRPSLMKKNIKSKPSFHLFHLF